MADLNVSNDGANDELTAMCRNTSDRRQKQRLRFSEEENSKPEKQKTSFKPPARASRFLSICDPSAQLPSTALRRLRQLHSQTINDDDSLISGDITDELLDKIPFKIQIIPDRRDDINIEEDSIRKVRHKKQIPIEIPKVMPTNLSEQRRLQIIEEILTKVNQTNVIEDIRRSNSIPFQLSKNNQLQKNVAQRIRDLTGNETIMLNDHGYMKAFIEILGKKHQEELEINFQRLQSHTTK